MILLLSDKDDKHSDVLASIMEFKNIPFFRLNLDVESLKSTYIDYNGEDWYIKNRFGEIASTSVSCVCLRRAFVELSLEEGLEQSADFRIWKNEWNKTLMGLYLGIKNIPWINPLRKAYKAENKYLQMNLAKELGFNVPKTIVSNQKKRLLDFCNNHSAVVMKMMAQEFYQTADGSFKGLFVNKISSKDMEVFQEVSENPIVLQEYIEKEYEVRYTVVGNEHFVSKIDSQKSEKAKTDWRRYDIANTPHYALEPDESIKTKVSLLMKELGLEYGALDFIVTPKQEWYFLEVNAMGQWLWIEDLTGLKISEAIVNWLSEKRKGVRT